MVVEIIVVLCVQMMGYCGDEKTRITNKLICYAH